MKMDINNVVKLVKVIKKFNKTVVIMGLSWGDMRLKLFENRKCKGQYLIDLAHQSKGNKNVA